MTGTKHDTYRQGGAVAGPAREAGQPDLFALLATQITPGWHQQAACADLPGNCFYPDPRARTLAGVAAAVEACNGCPVRASCRAVALLRDEHGVWGGATEADRDRMQTALCQGVSVDVVLDETIRIPAGDGEGAAA